MTKDQLKEFFREKKEKAKPADYDWAARRDEWIQAVKDLYNTIVNDYLEGAKEDVDISYPDKVVTENYIGEYHIPELNILVGSEQVVFSPKGANVFGAKGRIDVLGEYGEATIVRMPGDRWSFVASRTPTLKLVPLTADTFAEMLKGIMRS